MRNRKALIVTLKADDFSQLHRRMLSEVGIDVVRQFTLLPDLASRTHTVLSVVATARDREADEIIIRLSSDQLGELDVLLEELRAVTVPVRVLPDADISRLVLQPCRNLGGMALVDVRREPLSASERLLKRLSDVLLAGLGLATAAPLLAFAIAAVKLDSPGPALFRQTRKGFNGRSFKILKLRTMRVLEDGDGIAQAQRLDPRVTRVGYWLRRTSIDELPQLWNVLRGEMSIVGPRPHAVAHDNYYDQLIENYAYRQHVKPGLTGWAQVNGHRGETPEISMMAARVDHDVWYIANWSFMLDLRIIVLTATKLLTRAAY